MSAREVLVAAIGCALIGVGIGAISGEARHGIGVFALLMGTRILGRCVVGAEREKGGAS